MRSYSKYFLCSVLFFFSLKGCKKNNDPPFNYIRGKLDGLPFECSTLIHGSKVSPGLGTIADPTVRISGSFVLGNKEKSIQLFLNHEASSITTGTYYFQPDKDRSAFLAGDWIIDHSGYCSYCPIAFAGFGSITITGITTKYVKGAFTFTTGPNGITSGVRVVTDGEFYVQRF